MIREDDSKIIEAVHSICCGLDIHKDQVSACLLFHGEQGHERSEVKEFGTFTDDPIRMREWLLGHECPILAREHRGLLASRLQHT